MAPRLRPGRRLDLRGSSVLITGGSRGLGLQLAREHLRRGARVAICGRDQATLERARDDLGHLGEVLALPCDVRDPAAVDTLVDAVRRHLGGLDVLVANAGVITAGPVEVMTREAYREAMDTMFWGALNPILAVVPGMRAAGRGSIVAITSIGGRVSVPHLLPYCTAKSAAVGLSEGLHAALAGDGIRVTTVVPGLMRTGSHRQARFTGRPRAEYAWFALAATAPLLSVSVERAARRIVDAEVRGAAEVTVGLPARILALVHGVAPGTTARLLGVVDRLLPGAGAGAPPQRGAESESALTRSPLTALGRRAERSQNQMGRTA
jgi:NAD(P)-dependent dehydrogenase (short-subunit alcohol dehydrogenase family)